jgi:hypothetical protein
MDDPHDGIETHEASERKGAGRPSQRWKGENDVKSQ